MADIVDHPVVVGAKHNLLQIRILQPKHAKADLRVEHLAAALARGVPLTVFDIAEAPIRDLYEAALVLVRPDGHVAWRSNDVPADPMQIIDTVRGAG